MAQDFDPEGFAQRQLDAYNARDTERFIAEYTEDVTPTGISKVWFLSGK